MFSTLLSVGAFLYLSSSGHPLMTSLMPLLKGGVKGAPKSSAQPLRESIDAPTETVALQKSVDAEVVHPQERRTVVAQNDSEPERMVQIYGKWYKYRPDNRYVIDGVSTLHIPKRIEMRQAAAPPVAAANAPPAAKVPPVGKAPDHINPTKSQKLMEMAGSNPMSVYTPEGFQALKDGLEAAKNGAEERKKFLEQLDKEP